MSKETTLAAVCIDGDYQPCADLSVHINSLGNIVLLSPDERVYFEFSPTEANYLSLRLRELVKQVHKELAEGIER